MRLIQPKHTGPVEMARPAGRKTPTIPDHLQRRFVQSRKSRTLMDLGGSNVSGNIDQDLNDNSSLVAIPSGGRRVCRGGISAPVGNLGIKLSCPGRGLCYWRGRSGQVRGWRYRHGSLHRNRESHRGGIRRRHYGRHLRRLLRSVLCLLRFIRLHLGFHLRLFLGRNEDYRHGLLDFGKRFDHHSRRFQPNQTSAKKKRAHRVGPSQRAAGIPALLRET